MSDKYLENEVLPVVYNITEDKVEVFSNSTGFAKVFRLVPIEKNELISLYSKLKKLSRPKYFKSLPEVNELIDRHWTSYLKEIELVNLIFENIRVVYREIEKRGIRRGCVDDKLLSLGESLIHKHRNLTGYGASIGSVTAYHGKIKSMIDSLEFEVRFASNMRRKE